jgi:hypothetical protein
MNTTASGQPVDPGQSYVIDLFRPEDAAGVVRLFRTVYGEGYPVRTFTDPQRLIEENAAKRTISSVARTPRGEIVAHCAVFRSAPYERLYEAGSGLVLPSYRGGAIMTRLVAHGFDAAARFGVEALFGEAVCNHIHMQKIMSALDNVERALAVDLMPADTYAREKSATGRVSVLMGFNLFKPNSQAVYVPRPYASILPFLYQGMGDQRRYSPSEGDLPAQSVSRIETQVFDFAQVARLAIQEAGQDFAEVFAREEEAARGRNVTVLQVWLKLSWPWVGQVTELLRARGYFLGGVLPRWFDDDGLLLQKILGPPNWDEIQLYTERAKMLLEIIRMDWARVVGPWVEGQRGQSP